MNAPLGAPPEPLPKRQVPFSAAVMCEGFARPVLSHCLMSLRYSHPCAQSTHTRHLPCRVKGFIDPTLPRLRLEALPRVVHTAWIPNLGG